jgi:hypothetical protein
MMITVVKGVISYVFQCYYKWLNPSRGPFPRGKARQGRDADHSPPSSAEVKNE